MRNYNSQYAAYMEANNHVNNVIIEYVEGIEVVKAFNQSTSSYEKFVGAVKSFKDFTLAWFKSTWKTMNLMMAIMPTTLLGVLPIGLLLTQSGSITPAELAMGIILSLSIVGPLMKATTFINEAKSMEYAVEAANELLNLPVLPGGDPNHMTEMLAMNIYQTFYARAGAQWKGLGQAKAVIFCLLVIVISLLQLKATRSKEVQQ